MENTATEKSETLEQTEAPWPPQAIVTPTDFRSVDYNSIVRDLKSVYDNQLETEFMKLARANRDNEPTFSVFRLLASACGLHFRLHDMSGAFGAKIRFENSRSPIPEDWLGQQTDYLFEILEEVEHPALRARLADVVWINDRKKGKAAEIAVEAYCECVEGLIDETYMGRFPSDSVVSMEQIDHIERATQIHLRSNKRTAPMHQRVSELLSSLYSKALRFVEVVPLKRLATLVSQYSLVTMDQLAADMEAAASAAEQKAESYPLAIKELWALAAFAYGEEGRTDDQRRCQLSGVDQTLKMAPQTDSSSGAAHWYRQAIGELRKIPDTNDRREELRKEMRILQEKSLEEMESFNIPVDLSEIVSGTIEVFEKLTLPEGLKQFALLVRPNSAEQMRKEAMESETGIAGIFAATHLDSEGKVIAVVEGASLNGAPPSESWVKSQMVRHLHFKMDIAVRGQLEPARRFLAEMFPLSERHFNFIVQQSPFIPRHHAATFSLGLARLMQGDMLSAGPILIPQLEHCLRHVLINNSTDTSKMRNDLTQEDRSLSALLDNYRGELVAIFGEDMILYIDLIFNHRPGPALRHEFAHGKIGDQSYADPTIYYACCLIYLLVCAPLLSGWAQYVASAIETGSF